ncbi:hypothetical protein BHYA_0358g00040 [Botrytis hyacinthi]|uniref:Uncharacterized protein n=1 Tax=Botrytis hyacinthi TaxID=278943 RepID=A0A4Z1GDK3_9HELO|nr:hypothetical protein BHYA_0358g00040 [Botrytis hyacinthi]
MCAAFPDPYTKFNTFDHCPSAAVKRREFSNEIIQEPSANTKPEEAKYDSMMGRDARYMTQIWGKPEEALLLAVMPPSRMVGARYWRVRAEYASIRTNV